MNTYVALLAQSDDRAAAQFEQTFQGVACDWRLVRVADGAAATRYIMQKGLPELLVTAAALPNVSGADLVEWLRSFRSAFPVPVVIYDEDLEETVRKHFLQNNVKLILTTDSSRELLSGHLSDMVSLIEKRRFSGL